MVSKLRLCRATQSARASASATVPIASTSTASYSPKIKVDVIGSKPSASPKGFGRSPTIAFPGAVKTLTPSAFDAMGAVMCVVSLSSCAAERRSMVRADGLALSGHPQPFQFASRPRRTLTELQRGALSDLDDVTIRIADVTAYLAILGDRLRDELGSPAFP